MPFIIIFLLSFSLQALELKSVEGKSYSFITKEKNRVSPNCQKGCKALIDYSQKMTSFKPRGGNPASEFCYHLGGKDRTLKHPSLDQDSVCFFDDASFILSWDLYRKNSQTPAVP